MVPLFIHLVCAATFAALSDRRTLWLRGVVSRQAPALSEV